MTRTNDRRYLASSDVSLCVQRYISTCLIIHTNTHTLSSSSSPSSWLSLSSSLPSSSSSLFQTYRDYYHYFLRSISLVMDFENPRNLFIKNCIKGSLYSGFLHVSDVIRHQPINGIIFDNDLSNKNYVSRTKC